MYQQQMIFKPDISTSSLFNETELMLSLRILDICPSRPSIEIENRIRVTNRKRRQNYERYDVRRTWENAIHGRADET